MLEFNLEIADKTRPGNASSFLDLKEQFFGWQGRHSHLRFEGRSARTFLSQRLRVRGRSHCRGNAKRARLAGTTPVRLLGEDRHVRLVLAPRRALEGSFDTAIGFLIDLRASEWEVDLRFSRETVAGVAQETRAPLTLVSHLLRQLPGLAQFSRERSRWSK